MANQDYNPFGPQKVGGVYFCGYWQQQYTVLAITEDLRWIRIQWDDGRIGTHMTPWDARRDKVIRQPE